MIDERCSGKIALHIGRELARWPVRWKGGDGVEERQELVGFEQRRECGELTLYTVIPALSKRPVAIPVLVLSGIFDLVAPSIGSHQYIDAQIGREQELTNLIIRRRQITVERERERGGCIGKRPQVCVERDKDLEPAREEQVGAARYWRVVAHEPVKDQRLRTAKGRFGEVAKHTQVGGKMQLVGRQHRDIPSANGWSWRPCHTRRSTKYVARSWCMWSTAPQPDAGERP